MRRNQHPLLRNLLLLLALVAFNPNGSAQDGPHKIVYNLGCRCYGLVNDAGDTILPVKYVKIEFDIYPLYLVYEWDKDHELKMGAYDMKGNEILPVNYNSIRADKSLRLIRYSNSTNSGAYSTELKKHTPPGVHYIRAWSHGGRSHLLPLFYTLTGDKGSIVLNAKFEPILITEKQIRYPIYPISDKLDEVYYMFGLSHKEQAGIMNASGEIIIPPNYKYFGFTLDGLKAVNSKHHDLYFIGQKNTEHSFKYIQNHGNYFSVKTNDGSWQLRDSSLNIVLTDDEYGLTFTSEPFDPSIFDYEEVYYEGSTFGQYRLISGLHPDNEVVVRVKFEKAKARSYYARPKGKKVAKFGLTAIKTGKKIPVDYQYIISITPQSKRKEIPFVVREPMYYWAIKKLENKQFTIDVYDPQLRLVNSQNVSDSTIHLLRINRYLNLLDSASRIVQNTRGQFGFLRPNGSIQGKFQFTRCRYIYSSYQRSSYHLLGNATHYGVYDNFGKQLIPVKYDSIIYVNRHSSGPPQFVGVNGDKFTWFNAEFQVAMEGISKHMKRYLVPKVGESRVYYRNAYYVVKDEKIYIYEEGKFTLLNDERVRFRDDTRKMFHYTIDRSGKIQR